MALMAELIGKGRGPIRFQKEKKKRVLWSKSYNECKNVYSERKVPQIQPKDQEQQSLKVRYGR
jgi:hypothetical protein